MNRAYKSIYNERTGTFVAVAENVKAKGKRSSSRVRLAGELAALATACILVMGSAQAEVSIPEGKNKIVFTAPEGSIEFGSGGSITGLSKLTIDGSIKAGQLTVASGAQLASGNMQVVTGGQLYETNQNVAAANAAVGTLADRVTANESTLDNHEGRITANRTDIDDHENRITANRSDIDDHAAKISENVTAIADNRTSLETINNRLETLGVDDATSGIKYFRVKSEADDAEAIGDDSVAIGPKAKAAAGNSLAAGVGSEAREGDSVAVGSGAIADGKSSVALGDGAKVNKPSNGSDPEAAIAIGKNSESSGLASTAIGKGAKASGSNAIAFGSDATAAGAGGVALGEGAVAAAENNISIGSAAGLNTSANLPNDQSHNIAIGAQTGQNVGGQFNVAMGDQAGSNVSGNNNIAFGHSAGAGLSGHENVSIGKAANEGVTANRSVGIGEEAKAQTEGVAIGFSASAGNTGVALGRQTTAVGTGTAIGPNAHADSNYVALGLNSRASQSDVYGNGAFTNRAFSGSAVSVGSGEAGSEFTRRIVNVEDGANDTDAVNVRQLQQAVSGIDLSDINFADGVIHNLQTQIDQNTQQYVSINDGGQDRGNKNNNGAAEAAIDSIAIGPDATTKNRDAIAIGHMAGAEGDSAVVLGHNIKGLGRNSTTIGNSESEARNESGIAIGTHVVSRDANSIVIGRDSYTDRQSNGPSVENSIVIGTESKSTAVEGIVIGKGSVVNAARGIAQGSAANATADDAMAFGTGAHATADSSQASGTDAKAYAARGIAMGANARSGHANPQVGDQHRDSIAIGSDSVAEQNSSIATGNGARATANYSQAFGFNAQASGVGSIAQGRNATALGTQAIALGDGAQSTSASAVAIGQGATAGNARSVALGDGATTDSAVGTTNASLAGITYGDFAGNAPTATVSVGNAGEKRTITNVAAGRVTAESTDAINGSQLFATNTVLGNVANSIGDGPDSILGGNVAVGVDGTLTMSNIGDTGEHTVHDAIKYAAQGWRLAADGVAGEENIAPGETATFAAGTNLEVDRDGGTITYRTSDDVAFTTVNVTDEVTIAGNTTINAGGITTNHVTSDEIIINHNGDQVNVGEVLDTGITFVGDNGAKTEQKLGSELAIAGDDNITTSVTDGQVQVALNDDLTGLNSVETNTINVGGGAFVASDNAITIGGDMLIDMGGNRITKVAPGVDGTDAVNVDQLDAVGAIANKGWNLAAVGVAGEENIAPGETATFAAGTNLEVDRTGGTITYRTSNDVAFTTVNVTDEVTVAGNTTINADGITTNHVTSDEVIINHNGGQVNVGEVLDTGITFVGDNGAKTEQKLGSELAIAGDDNITTSVTDGQVQVALNSDLTGLNSVETNTINVGGGTLVAGNNAFTIGGDTLIDMGGNRITNVAPGVAGTDAVNVDQLDAVGAIANKGWNVTDADGNTANIGPSGQVQFTGDGNIAVAQTGEDQEGVVEITLNRDLDVDSLTAGDTVIDNNGVSVGDTVVNNAGVSVGDDVALTDTGLVIDGGPSVTTTGIDAGDMKITNVAAGDVNANSTDAINGSQLFGVADNVRTIVGGETTIDPDTGVVTTTNIGDTGEDNIHDAISSVNTAANAGWNVTDAHGNTANIGPNGQVVFTGDDNIAVAQTGDDQDGVVEITLNRDLDVDSLTAGDTVIDNSGASIGGDVHLGNTGLIIDGGPSVTMSGINAGGMVIANVAPGILDTDAVNYGQLRPVTDFLDLDANGTFAYNGGQHNTLKDVLDSMHWNVEAPAPDNSGDDSGGAGNGGSGGGTGGSGNGGGNAGDSTPIHNSNTLGFVEGDNIVISKTDRLDDNGNRVGADVKVGLADDIAVNSITAVQVDAQQVTANEVKINNGGPIINENGIDMSDNRITNVADGVAESDAVNVGQLQRVEGNMQNQINDLRGDMRRQDRRLRAGVAAAMATASLPQAYLPGKSMMAVAGGTWNGESGMAIGYSGISDNGKWVFKVSGNASSRGDYGGAVGMGYQW